MDGGGGSGETMVSVNISWVRTTRRLRYSAMLSLVSIAMDGCGNGLSLLGAAASASKSGGKSENSSAPTDDPNSTTKPGDVDEPTQINGCYLTCDWLDKSSPANTVSALCQWHQANGALVTPGVIAQTNPEWSVKNIQQGTVVKATFTAKDQGGTKVVTLNASDSVNAGVVLTYSSRARRLSVNATLPELPSAIGSEISRDSTITTDSDSRTEQRSSR